MFNITFEIENNDKTINDKIRLIIKSTFAITIRICKKNKIFQSIFY